MTHSLPRWVRVLGMAAALGASERTGGAEGAENKCLERGVCGSGATEHAD